MAFGLGFTSTNKVDYRKIPNNTKSWWFLDPALRWNMLHSVGVCGAMFFNGYDGALFNGLQSIDNWQDYFGHPDSNILGLMNSSGFLPGIIAGIFAAYLNDFMGRRNTMWVGCAINVVGIIVMSLSTSVGMFCGGRVLIGFGVSMALAMAPPLLQETAHPRFRAAVGAFFTSIYYIAAIMSAAICLRYLNVDGERSWRIPCWIQIVGPAATFLLTCTMSESPRWLVKKGKFEQARAMLIKYHANGKEDDELVAYEYNEIVQAIKAEDNLPQTSYLDFVRSPGNRHRLLILVVVGISLNWVGNGIISYYLDSILNSVGITDPKQQLTIQVGIQCWNLVISTGASVFIDSIGRRPLWLTATATMTISMAIIMGLSYSYAEHGNKNAGIAVIPFLFIFFAGYDIAYTPMSYSYPIEILTYTLRTKGSGLYIMITTLAVALNTWCNPVGLKNLKWKFYSVYIAIDTGLFVIQYFHFPEIKNRTIEEIAEVFDGPDIAARDTASGPDGVVEAVGSIHEAAGVTKD